MITDFDKLFDIRHSGREFDSDKILSKEDLIPIFKIAHTSPSCFNDQPWRYLIFSKQEHPEGYKKLGDCLAEKNQQWALKAPVLILVCADTQFEQNGKPNRWGAYDSGAASGYLVLKAAELGIMTHQMGGFDEKKAVETLNIPARYTPMSVMAVGFEAANAPPYPKNRRPFNQQFFWGGWDEKI